MSYIMEIELCKSTLSLDQAISSVDDDDLTLIDKIPSGDYQEFMNSYENKIMLAAAIKKLPKDLQQIIDKLNAVFPTKDGDLLSYGKMV